MKLKSAIKYRYQKTVKVSGVFYALMFELFIGALIIRKVVNMGTGFGIGIEDFFPYIMWIFTFVIGLTAYSKELDLFLQNGASRQDTHYSFISVLPVSFVYALISFFTDYLFYRLDKAKNPLVEFVGMHPFIRTFLYSDKAFVKYLQYILLVALCYMLLMTFGYMLGAISRSMRTFYKVLTGTVFVAVIILGFTLWNYYSPEWIETAFIILKSFFMGVAMADFGRIVNFVTATLVLCTVNLSVAHLLVRKAVIKKGAERK